MLLQAYSASSHLYKMHISRHFFLSLSQICWFQNFGCGGTARANGNQRVGVKSRNEGMKEWRNGMDGHLARSRARDSCPYMVTFEQPHARGNSIIGQTIRPAIPLSIEERSQCRGRAFMVTLWRWVIVLLFFCYATLWLILLAYTHMYTHTHISIKYID